MKSFSILRTNVGLTTNVKIMIDSDYNLSLDSIDSNYILSADRYKKFKFNSNTLYDELLPIFFKNTPSDISFQIKYNNDVDIMSSDFKDQYDEIYNYGARNIINNKNYKEEFEYFAPLYIKKNNLPSNFIIFRVDGLGIDSITKENFKENIINNLKVVKVYDLTLNSKLGQWINKNFTENNKFPDTPLEIYFEKNKFSKWNGINLKTGGYTSKSIFLDDIFEKEREIFELEKFIFSNYQKMNLSFPNIINFSFLFDDEPSTSISKRKWSINRYFGFYLNSMDMSYSLSTYNTKTLRNDIEILEGNILSSPSNPDNPFVDNWNDKTPFYIEYNNEYYIVNLIVEEVGYKISEVDKSEFINEEYDINYIKTYKIISDLDLTGLTYSSFNKNYGFINNDNVLMKDNENKFEIPDFDRADVWIINIDGIYHNLIYDSSIDSIKINSDYSFYFENNYLYYKINSISKKIEYVVDFDNKPQKFDIFKLNFTDIKDFDTNIIDTEYSKYEYEKKDELTLTDEPKMYFENINNSSTYKNIDDFIYKEKVVNIPVSSEYTANHETFKVENNELSDIWRINPIYCRWVYQNSLSCNDYPYPLNNSFLFEKFNKSCDVYDSIPNRSKRNLDYFYTINSSTSSYINHTLHIEDFDNIPYFDFDTYIDNDYQYDYFTSFFERKAKFDNSNIIKNVKKYSYFNKGDISIPNTTLFKGIEFKIYDVDNISINNNNEITNINVINKNTYEDYKFSILLTAEKTDQLTWRVIENWQMDKTYNENDLVLYNDILYSANTQNVITDPTIFPYNSTNWDEFYSVCFFDLNSSYTNGYVIYNGDNFYEYDGTGTDDIWDPSGIYSINDIVLFDNKYYISMTDSNSGIQPNTDVLKTKNREFIRINYTNKYWSLTQSISPKWKPIEVWNPGKKYEENILVYYDYKVYKCNNNNIEIGDVPGISTNWLRYKYVSNVFDLVPDTDYAYLPRDIIKMNNRYYRCESNNLNETLENGIHIYINKKWKNVLINIYINDNTLDKLSEFDRDDMYDDLYNKLTAFNFISSINNLSEKYGFSDYLKYTIINEDGSISLHKFDQDIKNLPSIIVCEVPTKILVQKDSLIKKISRSILINPTIKLVNSNILDISKLDWYNNIPLSYSIDENKSININNLDIYRYSGYYMPLFYDIQIFNNQYIDELPNNYKFDTELTNFGIMKERKIRKVNRNGSNLKLNDSKIEKSIYPMIQEFGYTIFYFMIFKSTWDFNYHVESLSRKNKLI